MPATNLSSQLSRLTNGELDEINFISGVTSNLATVTDSFVHYFNGAAAMPSTIGNGPVVTVGFQPGDFTEAQKDSAYAALQLWSGLVNVTFSYQPDVTKAAVIFGQTNDVIRGTTLTAGTKAGPDVGGVVAGPVATVNHTTLATVTIDDVTRPMDSAGNPIGDLSYGDIGSYDIRKGYGIDALVHEIGHILGLGHDGKYDGTVDPTVQQRGIYDVRTWSIMSYIDPVTDLYKTDASGKTVFDVNGRPIPLVPAFSASYTVNADWNGHTPYTPMGLDIIAAQRLNGAPTSTMFDGNDTFGFNSTITYKGRDGTDKSLSMYDFTQDQSPVVTLYDYGTNNTLDLSGFAAIQTIDLNDGVFSSIAGLTNNLFIEWGTQIDHVIGGTLADTFTVNLRSDVIDGGDGSDTVILPGVRTDYVFGTAGLDEIVLTRRSTGAAYDLKNIEQYKFGSASSASVVLTDLLRATWVGGSGATGSHFGIAANWDNNAVPNASSQVKIGAGKAVLVTDQETNEVDSLSLAIGSSIDVASGHFVVYDQGSNSTNYGTIDVEGGASLYFATGIVNTGTIALHGGGGAGDAQFLTQSGTFTLSGFNGHVTLDSGGVIGGRTFADATPFDTFINVANTISGSGTIGRKGFANTLNFHNEAFGTVKATGPGVLLLSSATTNSGTLMAEHGTLDIRGAVDQSPGGHISAAGADSTIFLDGGNITGGTIEATSGATIEITANTTIRDAILTGHIKVDAGVKLTFAGSVNASGAIIDASAGSIDDPVGALRGATITLPTTPAGYASGLRIDSGTIGADVTVYGALILKGAVTNAYAMSFPLTGQYGSPTLSIDGAVTLSGGGRITLSGTPSLNVPLVLLGYSSDALLDNVDNTISGFGYFGNGALGIVNETAGTINAVAGTMIVQGFQSNAGNIFNAGYGGPLGITNHGLMEATAGGTLNLLGIINNSGGRIAAAGGTVLLGTSTLSSGLLTSTAGSRIEVRGDYGANITATLSGATAVPQGTTTAPTTGLLNQATIEVDNLGTLVLSGAITNQGSIAGTAAGSLPGSTIKISGATTLTGGGILAVAATNFSNLAASATLDNVDNTITGYGNIGNGHGGYAGTTGLALTNEAAASLIAQQGNATFNAAGEMQTLSKLGFRFLELDTGTTAMINKGIVGAGGGTLVIDSTVDSTQGGSIVASSVNGRTATVQLAGGTLRGGTITTDAVDRLSALRITSSSDVLGRGLGGTLDGSAGAVTLTTGSQIIAQDNAVLTLKGAIVNSGAIAIRGSSDTYTRDTPSLLNIDAAGATLGGGGTIQLSSLSSRQEARTQAIGGATAAATLRNIDDTISGFGAFGHGGLTVMNEAAGTITATGGALQFLSTGIPYSNPENTLIIDTGAGAFTNKGKLQAVGGTVTLRTIVDSNGGGRVNALAAGSLSGAILIDGGTLRGGTVTTDTANAASGIYLTTAGGTFDGRAGALTLAAGANATIAAGRTLTIEGSIANRGIISLNGNNLSGTAGFARIAVTGPTTLSGAGTIEMKDFGYTLNDRSTHQVISGASTADVLENVDDTIEGSGRIGNGLLTFRNDAAGIVRAKVSSLVLDTGAATITNAGTLIADGGNLTVASTLDNTGGVVEARNGVVTLESFSGGTLRIDQGASALLDKGMQGGTIEFTGDRSYIDVVAGNTITATVRGLTAGTGIYLDNVVATGTYQGGVMTLTAGGQVVGRLTMAGATAADSFVAISDGAGGTVVEHSSTPQTGDVSYTDVITNTSGKDASDAYSGPVDYLRHQYIWAGTDIVALSAATPDSFIKGGDGGDAIMVTGGHNVLDGGGGSNFLIGGTGADGGSDVFFVDSRESLETWSTIVNFHKGDLATIFGYREGLSTRPYTDNDGAPGYTGITIHSEINGPGTGIKGSMTFAGIDRATADAHFEITSGTLPGDIGYLLIEYK